MPDTVLEADVAVQGERIAGLLKTAEPIQARQVIDARGLYVVPGGIDAHVHFDMEFLGQSKHTFESGTIAAAFGGTTTIIDFTLDLKTLGGPLLDAVEKRREKAEGKAVIDFAFHCVVNDGGDDTLRELEQVVAYGVPSFKMFTVYREVNLYVNDATVYNVMERLRDLGGIAAVHTENADIVDYCTARLLAAGQRSPIHYPQSRPTFTEVECIRRVLFLARSVRGAVYVVHIAAGEAVAGVARLRRRRDADPSPLLGGRRQASAADHPAGPGGLDQPGPRLRALPAKGRHRGRERRGHRAHRPHGAAPRVAPDPAHEGAIQPVRGMGRGGNAGDHHLPGQGHRQQRGLSRDPGAREIPPAGH